MRKPMDAQTLCWRCKHAVPSEETESGCDWSRYGKPIVGWVAQRQDVRITRGPSRDQLVESYQVNECPYYEAG